MTDRPVLFDVNALVALCVTSHLRHHDAHAFLRGVSRWATCPVTEAGLFRLLLNPLVVGAQRSIGEVQAVVSGFRTDPRWQFLADRTTLADPRVETRVLQGHRQVTDLHLVNLARAEGAVLATFDRALLEWLDPRDRELALLIQAREG
ncbi:MAG: PIN domain nuclease [Propionibacteriaceae bacterium]|nr:PIN domain nuclease [Propionibacteriaceae bacterium]